MAGTTTYDHLEDLPLEGKYPVVWLASWYPSRTAPVNGDFIQRHAEAVALFMPLLVIHAIHDPALANDTSYALTKRGQLTELIMYFRGDEPAGLIPAVKYNLRFYGKMQRLIKHVIDRCGRPDLLHIHVPMKMGRLGIWAKRSMGIPYMVSEHSSKYIGNAKDSFQNRSAYHRRSVKEVFRKADLVTNVSHALGVIMEKLFDIPPVQVVRNVADTSVFHYRGKKPGNTFRFLHASTLSPQKNPEGLLRSFQQLYQQRKDFELVVLGGYLPDVTDAPWLTCMGEVTHQEVAGYMADADAFVLFSQEENFPCVIVEALCSGLPVVSSDAGGCAEAINSQNGIVVTSENEKALLGALNSMIDQRGLYNRSAISSEAGSCYSYHVIGKQFVDLYRKFIS